MSGFAGAATAWVSEIAWQAGLLALVALVADALLARRGLERLRHGIWLLVILRFLLPPSLAAPWSVVGALRAEVAAPPLSGHAAAAPTWPLLVWAAGTAAVALVALLRTRALAARIRRGAAGAVVPEVEAALRRAARRLGVRRVPRVVATRATSGPALTGWLRPVLLVPADTDFARWPARSLEHVFLHELLHLRRRDLHVAACATLVRAVFWFHPAAWLAARRTADLREVCCDLDAAAACGDGRGYRDTLLDAAARRLAPAPRPALAWLGHAGIVGRIEALEKPLPRRSRLRRAACAAGFLVSAACALPMAAPHDGVALARRLVADAAAGRQDPSCIRLLYAIQVVAAADAAAGR